MKDHSFELVDIAAYKAIGMKWEGAYSEVPDLKNVIHSMSRRVKELEGITQPVVQLGLSYHVRPDGFLHYSVYEVDSEQEVPEEMVEINIPAMTYFKTHHKKGEEIGRTYHRIYQWLKESQYKPYRDPNVAYFDDLPIKHERYPHDRDLKDPHFDILIPIERK